MFFFLKRLFKSFMRKMIIFLHNVDFYLQAQVRRKEDQCTGSIWDCLPITEKAKDEIDFAGLNDEVGLEIL